jgi:FdhD protein
MASETLTALPDRMRAAQQTFSQTGGLHAAAIFDLQGNLLILREDAGRHNAVDKVLGWGFLKNKLPFESHVLLVSGRASFEILQKALAARIPIIAAVSAPSSLAVEFAQESNQTLIGFLRGKTFNVYSHAERIGGKPAIR